MYNRLTLSFLYLSFSLSACFSSSSKEQPEFETSSVLERINDRDETPEWAHGETTLFLEKGEVVSIGITRLGGDARPDACMNVAAENGRIAILRQIQDNISSSGQLNDDDTSSDPGYEALMSFLSQGKLSGVKVTARYWEKRVESDATGLKVLKIHCAAKVAINRFLLDKQIKSALKGDHTGDPGIRQRLLESHKSFIDAANQKANVHENTTPLSME